MNALKSLLINTKTWLAIGCFAIALFSCTQDDSQQPNILFILSDDLGLAELSCTGSSIIKTPNIDRLRDQGILFTNAYSGSTVCAPSRCSLLTGKHPGNAQIRDNGEQANFTMHPDQEGCEEIGGWQEPPSPNGLWGGQRPLAAGTITLASALKEQGYNTACIGKWGLGGPGTTGEPNKQGFDLFFGYNCQRHAHNYYPRYLDKNGKRQNLPGNSRGATGESYAPDLMLEEAKHFIETNKHDPFFLFYATPVPHLALQVPEDSLKQYIGQFPDSPYTGKSYLPNNSPRATYAGMISRLDRDLGELFNKLESEGLDENTIIIFTSDNGSTFNLGGYDPDFFQGTGGLRGHKCNMYEGGLRVPLIVKWPGVIDAGSSDDTIVASWDWMPTLLSLAGANPVAELDGINLSPILRGSGSVAPRDHLYWEYHSGGGWQAVRMGDWKAIRRGMHKDKIKFELYNLESDPTESDDVAEENPEVVKTILGIMNRSHSSSPVANWNF